MGPSLMGFYRVGQKLSELISVLQITPRATEPSTVSVFLSSVKCGSACRAQTCAHSGIEPFRLAKGFPRGGPKSSKKFEFLTISKNLRLCISATVIEAYKQHTEKCFILPYPTVACVWTHRPRGSTGWSKNVECEWRCQ